MEGILLRFCDMGHVGRLSRGKADGQCETAFLYSCWTPPLSISNSISARLDLSSACNIYFPPVERGDPIILTSVQTQDRVCNSRYKSMNVLRKCVHNKVVIPMY